MGQKITFECDNTDLTSVGRELALTTAGGFPVLGTTGGGNGGRRSGTNCIRQTSTARTLITFPNAHATWTVGFALYLETMPLTQIIIGRFKDSGNEAVELRLNADGTFGIYRAESSVVLLGAASSFSIVATSWYYVECQVAISDTGSAHLRFNGSGSNDATAGGSPVDTKRAALGTTVNAWEFGGSSNSTVFRWMDFYANDGSGSAHTTFDGDMKIVSLLPSGDGANTGLTPSTGTDHFANVDDATPNDDTDYNSGASGKDTYTFPDLDFTPALVHSVSIVAMAKKDDAGARSLAGVVRQGGSDFSETAQALSTSYVPKIFLMEQDTADVNWTKTSIDACEFGVEVS